MIEKIQYCFSYKNRLYKEVLGKTFFIPIKYHEDPQITVNAMWKIENEKFIPCNQKLNLQWLTTWRGPKRLRAKFKKRKRYFKAKSSRIKGSVFRLSI